MRATIIVPFKYTPMPNDVDNIVSLPLNSASFASKLLKTIQESPYECVIILNKNSLDQRIINLFKSYFSTDKSLIWNAGGNNINTIPLSPISSTKINQFTSLCFNKRDIFGKTISIIGADYAGVIKSISMKLSTQLYFLNPTYVEIDPRVLTDTYEESVIPINVDCDFYENSNFYIDKNKPSIILIVDVKGWAWWNKSCYIKKYLSKFYNIHIITAAEFSTLSTKIKYDLYVTFGFGFIDLLISNNIPFEKRISGMTAHRPLNMLETYFKKVRAIHTNSLLLFEEGKIIHNNVFYTPNGVDTELFHPIKPILEKNSKLVVGHVGKRSTLKGQDKIIIPAIKKSNSIAQLHLNNFSDKIPFDKMWTKYQNIDVFLVASSEDGTPNPALEAMSCGRPVISNRIGNMPEIIEDGKNGFLVDLKIDEYVEKLKYLKNNRNHLIEMGKNARKVIEESWKWENQVKYYKRMFDNLLGG